MVWYTMFKGENEIKYHQSSFSLHTYRFRNILILFHLIRFVDKSALFAIVFAKVKICAKKYIYPQYRRPRIENNENEIKKHSQIDKFPIIK